jgi:glutathione synthase
MSPPSSYPPALSASESAALAVAAGDWALAHGLAVRPPPALAADDDDDASSPGLGRLAGVPVPVTLFPSPFPRRAFEQALAAQKAYNALYAAVSRDEVFLEQIVRE